MDNKIKRYKLGTRDSPLAMWQAHKVQALLQEKNVLIDIVPVKSEGDLDLVTPLYAMGVQGVFTKTLDAYLLSGHIDFAVHSMKDVPVQLAQGIVQAAVPQRAAVHDVIVWRDGPVSEEQLQKSVFTIGTGSVRRSSFWKNRYPQHQVENLRGNVQTRLKKLQDSNWIGAIFAKAGLERMEYHNLPTTPLEWMLPAPAQGALMVVCRTEDAELRTLLQKINDEEAALCVAAERSFLAALHGGCSTPIGALATVVGNLLSFQGKIIDRDGVEMKETTASVHLKDADTIGKIQAEKLLQQGADAIVEKIRNT